jgi:phage shock protein C
MSEIRRLYRSTHDAMAGGVCGGLAEYLETDPTIVRIAAVALTLSFPPLLLAYLLAWIIVPQGPESAATVATSAPPVESAEASGGRRSAELLAGLVLVCLGLFLLAERLDLFDLWIFRWIRWGNLWPLTLVGLGVYLVYRGFSYSGQREGARAGSHPEGPPSV